MNWNLSFVPNPLRQQLASGENVVLLGSCFSDDMASHFEESGFPVLSNPFGTIFHPIALARLLSQNLNGGIETQILQREDLYFSWNCGTKVSANSSGELVKEYQGKHDSLKKALSSKGTLIITLGSAFAYKLTSTGFIVSNCHKKPASEFEKTLSTVEEMRTAWQPVLEDLRSAYPELNVIFTVSPVRHVKDGLIENNRSKARLIELVHQLCEEHHCSYFPSYEICIDDLRDYRFYKEDLVHPNGQAITHVWDLFKKTCVKQEDLELIETVEKLWRASKHKSHHPDSLSDTSRKNALRLEIEQFKAKYPELNLPKTTKEA